MSVPKQRQTSGRSKRRRSHHALKSQSLSNCSKCQEAVQSHRACENCGTYRGRTVLKVESQAEKKLKRRAKDQEAKPEAKTTEKTAEKPTEEKAKASK